jgi:YebC/PmpR family DNA-binding regulatory protein
MPKDNVDRAVKKALGNEAGADYQNVRYEGYGPGGVAIIVEGLTDNKNRTASDVRSAFTKFGGSLGEANSVSFQFNHVGIVSYDKNKATEEQMFEAIVEVGADDLICGEKFEVICAPEQLSSVRDGLTKKFGDPLEAKTARLPKTVIPVEGDIAGTLFRLIEALEDNDDVQSVTANCEFISRD